MLRSARSRRRFLAGVAGASALTLTGCRLLETDPASGGDGDSAPNGSRETDNRESPQLTEQVEAGELPTLDERLPDNPLTLEPVDRIGVYGGTWNNGILGQPYLYWADKIVGNENLVRYDPGWTQVIPNVAEDFRESSDGREYAFTLRTGLRWSDGEPFTSEDIRFWYEDVLLNEDLTGTNPVWLAPGGELGAVEIVDAQTVTFTFPRPNGLFLENLASGVGRPITSIPSHYMKQFHKDHNADVDELVDEVGAEDWIALFQDRTDEWSNPDKPVLNAWTVTRPIGEGSQVVLDRNPYYWKTDSESRQLPYIDRVVFDVVNDQEVLVLKATNGEVSLVDSRSVTTLQNKPNIAQNRESGEFRFIDIQPTTMNTMHIALNLNHRDSVKREIYRNKDFRVGLSHAIDRDEIINVVFQRQGEPWQAAPRREMPFFNERLAKQYTGYDVDEANSCLDQAGFDRRDFNGFRLDPEGGRILVSVEVIPESFPDLVDCLELVRGYWREVGIDMAIKPVDRSLLLLRKQESEHDAMVWKGDAGGKDAMIKPDRYVPIAHSEVTGAGYAQAWQLWHFTEGERGEEPPGEVKYQQQLYDEMSMASDEDARVELMGEILEVAAEQFYLIGTSLPPTGYTVVQENFHNVPKSMPDSDIYPAPSPTNPCQYFIE